MGIMQLVNNVGVIKKSAKYLLLYTYYIKKNTLNIHFLFTDALTIARIAAKKLIISFVKKTIKGVFLFFKFGVEVGLGEAIESAPLV
jgi:hypothetical protein